MELTEIQWLVAIAIPVTGILLAVALVKRKNDQKKKEEHQ